MHKYQQISYTLLLFLILPVLLCGNIAFGEDCRDQRVPANDLVHKGHVYTCEFDSNKQRLIDYCAKDNTESSTPAFSCPPVAGNNPLFCHICECKTGERDDNGKCKSSSSSTTNGGTGQGTSNGVTTLAESKTGGTGQQQSEQQNDDEKTTCPGGLFNSEGTCCKKIYYDVNLQERVCCEGILLSTNVPFIGQCIVFKKDTGATPSAGLVIDEETAFPILMGGLNRIMVSIILLISFVGILIGGVMISASGGSDEGSKKGKKIIGNVISALALLGASGVILKLINPNFFG